MALAMRVALGMDFLRWFGVRPARVLYIDGEMSRRLLKKRITEEVERIGAVPATFHALSSEDLELDGLNTKKGQKQIENYINEYCGGHVDLIIFDNIMSLIKGEMKDEESWAETLPWIRSLTKRNIAQIWVHHTGHDLSRQYGTKTREWQMDVYVQFEKIEHPETGVSFLLQFRKARERDGDNYLQFEDTKVVLAHNEWSGTSSSGNRKQKLSPAGEKFFDALCVAAGNSPLSNDQVSVATFDAWREECVKRGLLNPEEKPRSARTLFDRHKLELITRNWISCTATQATILK
jgi:hypothetical protein